MIKSSSLRAAILATATAVSTVGGFNRLVAQQFSAQGSSLDVDINQVCTIVDRSGCMLRQYAKDGSLLREVGGQGWGNDQFDHPAGIWAHNGVDVFVADFGNHRIQRFDKNLAFVSSLSTRDGGNPDAAFGYPLSISVSRLGDLFVCDSENSRVIKFGSPGTAPINFGGYSAGMGRVTRPQMVACGPSDQVLVLDPPLVKIFDTFGNFVSTLPLNPERLPLAIAADEGGATVIDSVSITMFDASLRPLAPVPLSTAGVETGHAYGVAVNSGRLFVLTDGRVVSLEDPRNRR